MRYRKSRISLDFVALAAENLRRAEAELDRVIGVAVDHDTPWRAIADAAGLPATSIRRRYQPPGKVRHRWPRESAGA